ncbi:MAG: lysoplasmalogenase [Anaerolineales bacterium]|nr:lysoplasmalogenase [Anaerolineales bacterium]
MNIFLLFAILFAALESLALWKYWLKLEYIAKPGVMVALFLWLFTSAGLNGALLWFGLGLIFSLAGDVLLMLSLDRFFLFGLVAFLLAHLAYVIGFNIPLPEFSLWGIVFAVMVSLGGARIIRRILDALASKGQARMRMPIIVYSTVISIMLLSAMIKLMDITWDANAALLVSGGAFLFYISDIILAWNKFVAPIQHGRIYNIAAYHLGQIMLIAGVIAQFE